MTLGRVNRDGLSAAAAGEIREAILEGRLERGVRLGEVELAEGLGISRAPVREALLRLEQEGLVTSSRYRGTNVVELTRQDIDELVTLRSALEALAWSRCSAGVSDQVVADLEDCVQRMRQAVGRQAYPELVRLDIEFHDQVMRAAGHKRLYSVWTAIKWQVALYLLNRRILSDDYHTIIVTEHQQLITDLCSGKQELAVNAIEEHIAAAHVRLKSGKYLEPIAAPPTVTKSALGQISKLRPTDSGAASSSSS